MCRRLWNNLKKDKVEYLESNVEVTLVGIITVPPRPHFAFQESESPP